MFVSVFEKHKIPLVLCGHNHLYTRSIPIYSGYPEVTVAGSIPAYNTYYDFTKKATTAYVDENTAPNVSGGTGIKHSLGGEESFWLNIVHDAIKNAYCEDHNIKLIRIPYWELNNVESILNNNLNIENILE